MGEHLVEELFLSIAIWCSCNIDLSRDWRRRGSHHDVVGSITIPWIPKLGKRCY
eukprot:SAG31_NODE_28574_length_408_cov_0.673139_1_plen_53_part_01